MDCKAYKNITISLHWTVIAFSYLSDASFCVLISSSIILLS